MPSLPTSAHRSVRVQLNYWDCDDSSQKAENCELGTNSYFFYLKIKIYKTIILPVVLYDCETWSLTLREESRLRVFENRILRRVFGPKRDDNGEWRRMGSGEGSTLRNFIACTVHLI